MSDRVELRCRPCGRSFRMSRDAALERKREGRARCQMCGVALELPAELQAGPDPVPCADDGATVEYRCGPCQRTVRRPRAEVVELVRRRRDRCQVCGHGLQLPADVIAEARAGSSSSDAGPVSGAPAATPIPLTCGRCGASGQAPAAAAGKRVRCKGCGEAVLVPTAAAAPACDPDEMWTLACPTCQAIRRVPAAAAGKQVACASCAEAIPVPSVRPAPPPAATVRRPRAGLAAAVHERIGLTGTWSVGCAACGAEHDLSAFSGASCPGCGGASSYRLQLEVASAGPWISKGAADALIMATNVVSTASVLAGGGGLFLLGEARRDPARFWDRFEEAGAPPALLGALAAASASDRVALALRWIEGQQRARAVALASLLADHGVECLVCQETFAPASQARARGLEAEGDDALCSPRCREAWRRARAERRCRSCRKPFVPPTRPPLDPGWQPKPWHTEGYCTKQCLDVKDTIRLCPACGKAFLPPGAGPVKRGAPEPKRWHLAGFCSKACHERGETPEGVAAREAPHRAEAPTVVASCACGKGLKAPASHRGLRVLCPGCRGRVAVPAQ